MPSLRAFLDALERDAELAGLLESIFEFAPIPAGTSEPDRWYRVEPEHPLILVATDGSGGHFELLGGTGPLLHVSSEGQAGLIAPTLHSGLELIVAMPYWRDVLKFSGGGKIEHMRKAALLLEEDMREDIDELEDARAEVREALGIRSPADPVAALHHSAVLSAPSVSVLSVSDSSPHESLTGSFTPASNPFWKD